MQKKIITVLALVFCLQGLSANVSEYHYGKGGMIYPVKSTALAMTYEKIDIDAYYAGIITRETPYYKLTHNYYYIEYHCYYEFRNHDNTGDFLMGFPVRYGNYVYPSHEPPLYNPQINDFRLRINNQSSGYTLYTQDLNPELAGTDYDEVYGFSVNFIKGKKTIIEIFYSIIQAGFSVSTQTVPEVSYILKSGSTLKDPILKADITVQFHFPAKIVMNESPANPVIKNSTAGPCTIVLWELHHFVPHSDISLGFELSGDAENEESRVKEVINQIKGKMDLNAYFQLQVERDKDEKQAILLKKELADILVPFYKTSLKDKNTSSNAAGFIIADIDKHPFLAPDAELVKQARRSLEEKAVHYVRQDRERFKAMISAMEADPLNWKLKRKAGIVFNTAYNLSLFTGDNEKLDINNYFLSSLFNEYQKQEWDTIAKRIDSIRKTTNISLFMELLAQKRDNAAEISEYIETFILEHKEFNAALEKRLADLTRTIWNNKDKADDAFVLEKLLHALHPLNYKYASGYEYSFLASIHDIFHYKRSCIRKAYYNLANFYFGIQFKKSIFYYKMALVYGEVSPFLDYLQYAHGLSGESTVFADDLFDALWDPVAKDGVAEEARVREQLAFLKRIYGDQKPWWKELVRPDGTLDLSEKAISELYTPERLLKLNLSAWTQEGFNDAPCYFITYNMACALSRIEKGKESLDWLKVAFKMNNELKKTALKDTDLAYLRADLNGEFDKLVK